MELKFSISERAENTLRQLAKAEGRKIQEVVKDIIENYALTPTLDEIFAPFQKEIAEKGITEEEIDDLVKRARKDYFAEKRARQ